ncbi:MAG: DPP IV N-terminal domain-containing protein [Desertifilum sp.]|nr:DPP IV N-terminal domain-containing protein [Desertifilum sp.]
MLQSRPFRFSFVSLFLVVGLLAGVSIKSSLAIPRLSNSPNSLVFTALQGRGSGVRNSLFLITADGSHRRNLTPALTEVTAPIVWSPDGRRLAFVNGSSDLYVMQANGSQLTSIFKGSFCKVETYQIVWSSNQRLVFGRSCEGSTLEEPGSVELYTSTLTSVQGTRKIDRLPNHALSLAISPNGQKVAFIQEGHIYSMNVDGSQLINLTQNRDSNGRDSSRNRVENSYNSGGSSLVWSPDSRRIAFWMGQYPRQQLYTINAEGSQLRQLTQDPTQELYNVAITWSPDSQKIAYTRIQPGMTSDRQQAIYSVDIHSGVSTQLTRRLDFYDLVKWSPNGRQLAFVRGEFNRQSIHTLNLANLQERNLVPRLPLIGVAEVVWSMDSQQLAFNFSESEYSPLYAIAADGTGLRRLSQRFESVYFPTWKP